MQKGCLFVLEILEESSKLLSAQQIHQRLREKHDKAAPGLTTVYRSLDTLNQKGLVHTVFFQDGEKRFTKAKPKSHHHQLICKGCYSTETLQNCAIESSIEEIAKEKKFFIDSHILEFFGYCETCSRR
ncbi:MAG: hypothetical protein GC193_10775 [Cryomorphaceae bacterium]|nr:hypothetical protein [Cryomorphaceae bacterium]